MLKNVVLSLCVCILSISAYHFYLTKKGIFSPSLKGIYTINLAESLDVVRQKIITQAMKKNANVNAEQELMKVQKALEKVANAIPDGYIILPKSIVLGGKRKEINLLTGEIKIRKNLDSNFLLPEKQNTKTK